MGNFFDTLATILLITFVWFFFWPDSLGETTGRVVDAFSQE